jgi:hypothetical protein
MSSSSGMFRCSGIDPQAKLIEIVVYHTLYIYKYQALVDMAISELVTGKMAMK